MPIYGVATDYEYTETHMRERIDVWSGPFMSVFEATGLSLPKRDGYMLTTYNGDKIRVSCPVPRNDSNYREVDAAVSKALEVYYATFS